MIHGLAPRASHQGALWSCGDARGTDIEQNTGKMRVPQFRPRPQVAGLIMRRRAADG